MPQQFRWLYYAGSPIAPDTMREAMDAFDGRLVQTFGQMESPMFLAVLDAADHRRGVDEPQSPLLRSAGRAQPSVDVAIIDGDGQRVAAGVDGEVVVRAPQTMTGDWGRPEATATTLVDSWLHTGDVGYLDHDSYLYVIDRVWGEAITAVLVPAGPEQDTDAVIHACRQKLARYRVPKHVHWTDELPRNAYGKVLKRKLRERYSERPAEQQGEAVHSTADRNADTSPTHAASSRSKNTR